MTVPTVASYWKVMITLYELNAWFLVSESRLVWCWLVHDREEGIVVFGIEELVLTTLVFIDVVDVVVCHRFGCLAQQRLDESVSSTQRGIEDLGGLDVERRSSIADLDVAIFLFSPCLLKMALLT